MFRRLKVYPNGYYNYKKHRKSAQEKKKASILRVIESLYHNTNGRPGYRMMKKLLEGKGIYLSEQTVRKYMNVDLGLKSVTRRSKYRYTRGPEPYKTFDNLVKQNFAAVERNCLWCTDFTYLFLADGSKRFNCTIIDLYDRSVVASVNGRKIDTELAITALSKALKQVHKKKGIVLHSDRGCQFTSKSFVEFCKSKGIIQSMSKPGYPYDNAPMERYYNTLKTELINLHKYKTEEDLFSAINAFAYGWYNYGRPHSFNGGLPPKSVA